MKAWAFILGAIAFILGLILWAMVLSGEAQMMGGGTFKPGIVGMRPFVRPPVVKANFPRPVVVKPAVRKCK